MQKLVLFHILFFFFGPLSPEALPLPLRPLLCAALSTSGRGQTEKG